MGLVFQRVVTVLLRRPLRAPLAELQTSSQEDVGLRRYMFVPIGRIGASRDECHYGPGVSQFDFLVGLG
jgi:hypothetical protein